jgi:hypothetical protein
VVSLIGASSNAKTVEPGKPAPKANRQDVAIQRTRKGGPRSPQLRHLITIVLITVDRSAVDFSRAFEKALNGLH